MPSDMILSRRAFLIGCSIAASPLLTPVTFAAAPGDNRLVVIILRGAMDGLDVVRPVGDAAYAAMRPTLLSDGNTAPRLNDYFALHPAAAGLMPLWQAGQLGFAHAVATPYRSGRSHFVGQDALENGTGGQDGTLTPSHDGWLNRALTLMPGAKSDTAVSVGQQRLLVLDGAHETDHWFPVMESPLSAQGQDLLSTVNAADPLFAKPYAEAQYLVRNLNGAQVPRGGDLPYAQLGTYVAERLMGPSRIASFSFGGWDTHHQQAKTIAEQLTNLTDAILAMQKGLGKAWDTTLVVGLTEFGRTARENGTGGTDHGTGGMAFLAGGALKGGKVYGKWPGLADGSLLADRDLMPTGDVRAYPAWALRTMFGVEAAGLQSTVFPGLDLGIDPGFLL